MRVNGAASGTVTPLASNHRHTDASDVATSHAAVSVETAAASHDCGYFEAESTWRPGLISSFGSSSAAVPGVPPEPAGASRPR